MYVSAFAIVAIKGVAGFKRELFGNSNLAHLALFLAKLRVF